MCWLSRQCRSEMNEKNVSKSRVCTNYEIRRLRGCESNESAVIGKEKTRKCASASSLADIHIPFRSQAV
eukprot:scaffold93406_cov33-Prasinocladus_malaysianus.AAC.1